MNTILYILVWMVLMTIIFIFIPNEKIKTIGDFFKKVIPTLPITNIVKLFKKN